MNSLHPPPRRAGEHLHPVLLNAPWPVCPPNRRLISLTVWNPDINASHPSEAVGGSRQSRTLSFKFLSRFMFLAFAFWFIHGSDLKRRSLVLEEALGGDLRLQCRQVVSSDPFLMFHPVLVCLSVLCPAPYCKAARCSSPASFSSSARRIPSCSSSITWVCLKANNQEFTPTLGGAIKASWATDSLRTLCFYDCKLCEGESDVLVGSVTLYLFGLGCGALHISLPQHDTATGFQGKKELSLVGILRLGPRAAGCRPRLKPIPCTLISGGRVWSHSMNEPIMQRFRIPVL